MVDTTTLPGILAASGVKAPQQLQGSTGYSPLSTEDFYAKYGYAAAVINSDPELVRIFNNAVANNWSEPQFTAAVENSQWFKNKDHPSNWRTADAMRLSDPATWAAAQKAAKSRIIDKAASLGYKINTSAIDSFVDGLLYTYGGNASAINYDDPDVLAQIVSLGDLTGGGTAQTTANTLNSSLAKYKVSSDPRFGPKWVEAAAKAISSGAADIEQYLTEIKTAAKELFPDFADEIDSGLTVMQAKAGKLSGEANAAKLKEFAVNMGVSYSPGWFTSAADSMAAGDTDYSYWQEQIKTLAKSAFPAFAKQIDAGMTVDDLASPYRAKIQSVLEIGGDQISLDNQLMQMALNSKDKDNNLSPMSLYDFEKALRNDPRWGYTKNARESVDSTMRGVLQNFGFAW